MKFRCLLKISSIYISPMLFLVGCSSYDINRTALVLAAMAGAKHEKSDPIQASKYKNVAKNLSKDVQRQQIEDYAISTGKADACLKIEDTKRSKLMIENKCNFAIYQIIQSQPIDNYDEEVRWYQVYGIGPREISPVPWDDKNGKSYFRQGTCTKKPVKFISRTVPIRCPLP